MKCKTTKSFASFLGNHKHGEVLDVPDSIAVGWVNAGLVVRVDEPENRMENPPMEDRAAAPTQTKPRRKGRA
jgi:hypothetical protein